MHTSIHIKEVHGEKLFVTMCISFAWVMNRICNKLASLEFTKLGHGQALLLSGNYLKIKRNLFNV